MPIYVQYLKNVSVGIIDRRHSCRAIALTATINRCIVELQANNRFRLKIYRLSQIYIYMASAQRYIMYTERYILPVAEISPPSSI